MRRAPAIAAALFAALVLSAAPARAARIELLLAPSHSRDARAATVARAAGLTGLRPAGLVVPEIGLVTLIAPRGPLAPLLGRLRALPGVAWAAAERRFEPRALPNDPALRAPDPITGTLEWWPAREGFPAAWEIENGAAARVGVIDTGIDAGHPELSGKLAALVDQQQPRGADGGAGVDRDGHGTHVASLACAATGNGIGIAGAGDDCRLVVEKTDFGDASVAAAIVDAANRHVQALNMSFGASGQGPPSPAEVRALRYALHRRVVLVAAAADTPIAEQGDPANVLQPAGSGGRAGAGIGLSVTAADYAGRRAVFAGYGSEISIAAFGAVQPAATGLPLIGVPGILGAFPGARTRMEPAPLGCSCRATLGGDNRYAYLEGTSMAVPQVAAAAALVRVLNPDLSALEVVRLLERTASRASGAGWSSDLGWGILDAGAALRAARTLDRRAPSARASSPAGARGAFTVRWRGADRAPRGCVPSGLAGFDVYVRTDGGRYRRILRGTRRHSLRFAGRSGHRYAFYVLATDRAGNRQRPPRHAQARTLDD